MKKKTARQIAAENLKKQDSDRMTQAHDTYLSEVSNRRQAKVEGKVTSADRAQMDELAISGAGGDPRKDRPILQGQFYDGKEYRPNMMNEPRPEEQMSRDFTPAWDTTYGGPYERKPDPRPDRLEMRESGAREAIATEMANNFAQMDWRDRQRARRAQDDERESIVRKRAESTNDYRDKVRVPRRD